MGYVRCIQELFYFGSEVHQKLHLGHNNTIESRYSLLKDLIKAKCGFKKFSNILRYIRYSPLSYKVNNLASTKFVLPKYHPSPFVKLN